MTGHVPSNKFDLAAIERAKSAERLSAEDLAGLLEWLQDPNWPVALPAADVLARTGMALVAPLKAALAADDADWTWSLETHLLPKLKPEVRQAIAMDAPETFIGPEISSGGPPPGGGGQTAPLARLGAWSDLPFFTDDWPAIADHLEAESGPVLPPDHQRFAALEHTQPEATRVVILGQDPYPTPGHANGLAFSVTPRTPLPKSLRNIFRELEDDIGAAPATGDLTPWADQGVLLLNTALSVPAGQAGGHATLGWQRLTEQVLARLSDRPRAFLLWGNHAQAMRGHVTGDDHLFIETAHPSPLSAYRGFFGSRPFSRVNGWLERRGQPPIRWA